jgi:DNA-binding NarL/FixJ family response regulator
MRKLRILLADDHETVREGLKAILRAEPDMEVVAEATDGLAAVAQAQRTRPDIVVMDVSMPQQNGLQATRALKQSCPEVRVVALTRHSDDGYLQQLLHAGASAYVLKQSRASELVRAIRAAAAGGSYLDPAVTSGDINDWGRIGARWRGRESASRLSAREEQVLRLVAWGFSNKEIAAQLELSVKTIEAHKANSMTKLGFRSRMDVVRYALLQGWLEET